MKKPRPESLFARLATADPSLELREWVFYAALVEGKGYEEIGGVLHDKGVHTSETAIGQMIARHALQWKLMKSRERAHDLDRGESAKEFKKLPEQIKKNLRRQIFNASMETLSVKEMVALHRATLNEKQIDIQLFDLQTEAAGLIGEVLRGSARAEELKSLAADKGLSGHAYIEAIRQRVYGEAAAPIPTKEGTP